jgi:hypothetical protein
MEQQQQRTQSDADAMDFRKDLPLSLPLLQLAVVDWQVV